MEKLIVVIVLYKCSLDDSESFKSLILAASCFETKLALVVYNNSPNYWNYTQKQYDKLNIIYVADEHNSGLGKAYNVGFGFAKKMLKESILLLDQDTTLPNLFFGSYLASQSKYKDENVDLFCPLIYNQNGLLSPAKSFIFSSKKLAFIAEGIHSFKELSIINSGLIISTQLFEKVGGYNEKIKLDFSDFDFLKRCLKYSNKIIVFKAVCYHSLSSENNSTKSDAVDRFSYYAEGAKFFQKSKIEAVFLSFWVFFRALKLNYKYKTLDFTKRLFFHN